MTQHERTSTLRRDLRAVWLDGLAWSVMVGMGETYIQPFALAVGMSPVFVGLAATLPMVLGSLAQLASPIWIRRMDSHRRFVVVAAGLQAASFLPMAIAAYLGAMPGWMLYLAASLYWAAGLATAPAWNTWVETIVPGKVRIRYFARRNRMLYVLQIIGILAAGWILDRGRSAHAELAAFAIVFVFAAIARGLSTGLLASQSEPVPMPADMRDVKLKDFVARFRHGPDGRLLLYLLSVQFTVQVAQPYFVPYMLEGLGFSYPQMMSLLAAAVLAKFVCLPMFGHFAERRGVRALLFLGGAMIVPAAALWLVTQRFELLLFAQFFTGAALGAYELASFLAFFEAIEPRERTSVLTTYNAANSTAIFAGSLVGGLLLAALGADARAFLWVFAASSVLRLATLPLLGRLRTLARPVVG